MNRILNDNWSGEPLLFAAFEEYIERLLSYIPAEEELAEIYKYTPRLDALFSQWVDCLAE